MLCGSEDLKSSEGGRLGEVKRMVGSTVLVAATKAAAIGCSLIVSIAVARVLGPAEFGIYAFAFALVGVIGLPVQMGLPTLIVRETARSDSTADLALMKGSWVWSTRLVLFSGVVCMLVSMTALLAWPSLMSEGRRSAVLWALPLVPLLALSAIRGAALRGLRKTVSGLLPDQILRPIIFSSAIFLAWRWTAVETSATSALAIHSAVAFVTFIIGTMILLKMRPCGMQEVAAKLDRPRWWKALGPLALISGMHLMLQSTDILMLAYFRSDSEVGLYRVAATGGTLGAFGLTAVNLLFQPYFARAFARNEVDNMQKLASVAAAVCLVATLPVIGIFGLWGADIIKFVFGPAFMGAALALLIVAIGKAACALFGAGETILAMTGHERSAAKFLLGSVVVNAVLNIVFIPPYGIHGAAASSAISVTLWAFLFWQHAKSAMGVDTSILSVSRLWRGLGPSR